MAEDWLAALLMAIALIAMSPVFFAIANSFNQQTCQPYINQIQQDNLTIAGLQNQSNQLASDLNKSRAEYNKLINENITKKDIEDIKQDLNLSFSNIQILDQKFDSIIQNFNTAYNSVSYNLTLSFVVNVTLGLLILGDLISVAFLNIDYKKKAIELVKNKLRRKKDKQSNTPISAEHHQTN